MNVVMVTKDRPKLTEQTIRSLYGNTRTSVALTVVDDCSSAQAADQLARLREEFGFALLWNAEPTPLGESKNRALAKCPPGLVYLTDNDVYFTPAWDDALLQAWEARPPRVALLSAGCHQWLGTNAKELSGGREFHYKDALSGWSWLMDRKLWDTFGPLDGNALGSGQSEDWAFCQRVKAGGFEVASIWPEVVIHCGRTNTEGRWAVGAETIHDVPGVVVE